MTIGEYIKEKLNLWSVSHSDALISAELSKLDLQMESEYNNETASKLDLFFYNLLPEMLLLPNSISEGGYSISFDKKAVEDYYQMLCNKLGKPNLLPKPIIKDISNQW
ncbi:DUF6706 family protein [Riemerella anatipestifer]|uniref:DUF6706 family protein n=1 Tax=Riemerella anatipestifer TaxID=34085 RepID=UPI002ECE1E79|nr:DUF6706 family protein [Riemerella anatipestifer]